MTDPMLVQEKLPLLIAFANLQSYQLLQRVATDSEGRFKTKQEVPPWAKVGGGALLLRVFQRRAASRAFGRLPRDHGRRNRAGQGHDRGPGRELRRADNHGRRSLPSRGWHRRARAGRSRLRDRDHRQRRRLRRTRYRDRGHGHHRQWAADPTRDRRNPSPPSGFSTPRGSPRSPYDHRQPVALRGTTRDREKNGSLRHLDLREFAGGQDFVLLPFRPRQGRDHRLDRLPFSIRILLENAVRQAGRGYVTEEHVRAVAAWSPTNAGADLPFMPSRVVLQDFTGVPAVVDLAVMRDGIADLGGDPARINPVVPADLVIDHSVQVDFFGTSEAYRQNVELEYKRNRERYALLRWAQKAFENFSVVPPGTGIVHQVNLEYLASVVHRREEDGLWMAYPDTLVGTDSHTTMINGIGVVGWGVGGIEAEAVLLGQPYYMLLPEVVGVKLTGSLPEGATATDLVLRVTELLREHGVVGKFVEYYGTGSATCLCPTRPRSRTCPPSTAPRSASFPVDQEALRYLAGTGRAKGAVERVERISKELGLFRTDQTPDPDFTSRVELDLNTIEPSLAGPKRPQDRVRLGDLRRSFDEDLPKLVPAGFSVGDGARFRRCSPGRIPARESGGRAAASAHGSKTGPKSKSAMAPLWWLRSRHARTRPILRSWSGQAFWPRRQSRGDCACSPG